MIRTIVFWSILGLAARSDIRTGKIPNRFILCGVCLGLLTAAFEGLNSVVQSLVCGPVMLIIGFILWKLRVFKAGDAKLFWVAGHFHTLNRLPLSLACIMIAGGVCSLWILCRHRLLKERLAKIVRYFQWCFLSRQYQPYQADDTANARLPFAVAVFLGEIISSAVYYLRMG